MAEYQKLSQSYSKDFWRDINLSDPVIQMGCVPPSRRAVMSVTVGLVTRKNIISS